MKLREFVDRCGRPFSEGLGIDLRSGAEVEVEKWFLASLLYSKPIRESTATLTYQTFEEDGVVTTSRVMSAGRERLVSLLDEGGYARYDFSTADKLLSVFGSLQKEYGGELNRLHDLASDSRDLERRIMALGKGVGPTTVSIFLREMRWRWSKADPEPTPLVKLAMERLGIEDIKRTAARHNLDVVRLETALLRLGKDFIRKKRELPEIEL